MRKQTLTAVSLALVALATAPALPAQNLEMAPAAATATAGHAGPWPDDGPGRAPVRRAGRALRRGRAAADHPLGLPDDGRLFRVRPRRARGHAPPLSRRGRIRPGRRPGGSRRGRSETPVTRDGRESLPRPGAGERLPIAAWIPMPADDSASCPAHARTPEPALDRPDRGRHRPAGGTRRGRGPRPGAVRDERRSRPRPASRRNSRSSAPAGRADLRASRATRRCRTTSSRRTRTSFRSACARWRACRRCRRGIVIVDLPTALQRLPPRTFIDGHALSLKAGEALDLEQFRLRLDQRRLRERAAGGANPATSRSAARCSTCSRWAASRRCASTCSTT